MRTKARIFLLIPCMLLLLLICAAPICVLPSTAYLSEEAPPGSGTKSDPYRIGTREDLLLFAASVNSGEEFAGEWFVQTEDIDLSGIEWVPIGIFGSDHYFFGVYDGCGHIISNLVLQREDNAGFFGQLGGTVMNLGIESGYISGVCTGAISSHSASPDALIINCYNKAEVHGARAGGIADNFNGTISNCWSDCVLKGDMIGGIVSYSARQVINCLSTAKLSPAGNNLGEGCKQLESMTGSSVCRRLNQATYKKSSNTLTYSDLNGWTLENDVPTFSSKQVWSLDIITSNWNHLAPIFMIVSAILFFVVPVRKRGR